MILIDTGPLVALADPGDPHHSAAVVQFERLRNQPLVSCVPVLVEACFHLSAPHVRRNLRQFMERFGVCIFAPENHDLTVSTVFYWLEKYADHVPDFADGWIAVLSGSDKRLKLWTFDGEFRTHWRRPDGSAIPLAIND